MPSIKDWLRASWTDFLRRWSVFLGVAGVTGAATLLGVFLPMLAAGLAALSGVNPWICFILGAGVSVPLTLWMSSWAQAAILRVALFDESLSDVLSRSWAQTAAFTWVLGLVLLAVGGGFYLLVLPGLVLTALLFFAPVYQMSGEAEGLRALELSWARVSPRFGEVSLRIFLAGLVTAAPGWIPYVGWLIAPFWAPFGIVATARLARDLRDAGPCAELPRLKTAVALLSLVCLLGVAASGWGALRLYRGLRDAALSGQLLSAGFDEATGQALIAVLSGNATEDQTRKVISLARSLSEAKP